MSHKVLVIEDNTEVRENVCEILELADFEVDSAENGKIGVEKAKKNNPDLILCDIMMPGLDGYGVLYILAKDPETSTIPFIFLTAKADKSDFRKGMSLGADDYLTKPFDETELLNAIELRLDKSQKIKQISDGSKSADQILESDVTRLLSSLSNGRKTKIFQKKSTIYYDGDYPNYLYYIKSGKVKTFKINEDGKEFITGIYSAGEFIGYMELLKETEHVDSAEALEEAEVYLIPKEDFKTLVYENREVSGHFIKLLSGSLIDREMELLALAYDTVRKRVADALLKISDKYEADEESKFSISREDIANMVGTATESVIRTLSEFKKEGVIKIDSSRIEIVDRRALERIKY